MKGKHFILLTGSLAIGIVIGYFLHGNVTKENLIDYSKCQNDYEFVNPRLGCRPPDVIKKHEYTVLVEELRNYIEQESDRKNVSSVSVYFRDLQNGPTFGIREDEVFAPASLLKVPLMITFYDLIEKDPSVLKHQTSYSEVIDFIEQDTSDIPELEKNKLYPIKELLQRMIIYSDNTSYWLLLRYLDDRYGENTPFNKVMRDLGIVSPRNTAENTITVKSYASLFRQLYNSSYLSNSSSEKALQLLSETKYKPGIVSGVPHGIDVAHKFGELQGLPDNKQQLHDCGIVYYPGNPYVLCIMTQGESDDRLEDIIKTISEKVYKEVDSRKLK